MTQEIRNSIISKEWEISNQWKLAGAIFLTLASIAATLLTAHYCGGIEKSVDYANDHIWTYIVAGGSVAVGIVASAYFGFRTNPDAVSPKKLSDIVDNPVITDEEPTPVDFVSLINLTLEASEDEEDNDIEDGDKFIPITARRRSLGGEEFEGEDAVFYDKLEGKEFFIESAYITEKGISRVPVIKWDI